MKKYINRVLIVCLIFSSFAVSQDLANKQDLKTNQGEQNTIDETVLGESPNIFGLLLTEAKRYYVEALVADYHSDTAEVKFALDKTLENISEISEIDSLTLLQKDDYNRFCDKLNHDFRTKFSYINGDSGTYSIASIQSELKTYIDTVTVGNDDLIVV